jgi:hypothetical protein
MTINFSGSGRSVSRWLCRLILFLCFGAYAAAGQESIVTFYMHGSLWTTGLPRSKHGVFNGNVFDGSQELFAFHDGLFDHNNRFITLRIPAGRHIFGATYGKNPQANETIQIDLNPDEHYFVRAQGETFGIGSSVVKFGRLDLMYCADALTDLGGNATPLKDKALSKYTRTRRTDMVVDEASLPSCK